MNFTRKIIKNTEYLPVFHVRKNRFQKKEKTKTLFGNTLALKVFDWAV